MGLRLSWCVLLRFLLFVWGSRVFGSRCGRLGVCGSLGACFRVLWPLLVGPFGSVSLVGAFGFLCGCLRVFVVASGSLAFPLGAFLFLCFFCCCPLALLVSLWFWRFVVLRVPQGSLPSPPQGASLSVAPPGVSLLVSIQTLGWGRDTVAVVVEAACSAQVRLVFAGCPTLTRLDNENAFVHVEVGLCARRAYTICGSVP